MNAINIQFSNITISSVSSNSGIFTGENTQSNWQVNRKNNFGFGEIAGYQNTVSNIVTIIHDNDIVDSDFTQYQEGNNQPVIQS
ncbi:hypothetical protein FZC79_20025 [Rossellomorea vietnamensis]|uniref:Uncharacterized protein n=2 Tax=Rossellomorea TaxID=2837508 RepID=A0A5D4K900_9BACI|nr:MULTISPECIES: hypothetical protein [Rossellomorea]TYR73190.1 hypothetical protein FZC79_20025 [Rossellomorea vietnamensis]TYS79669.1 hypothetical protein FZC80_08455 [Rossellomorea aquimaris]